MPYIEAKLSVKLDENQKNDLQKKLTEAVSIALSKPKAYIMANIEDSASLYMSENKIDGAYLSISLLGSASRPACQNLTRDICTILADDYNIDGSNVYITYHPVDLWGWNGSMF
jgi:phenylpyruvate tautomerase PptA (4-oxalocrotonate tautomerase family)